MNTVGMAPAPTTPRPRSRGFSFNSNKSGGSAGRSTKDEVTESPRERQRRENLWNKSKANPNAALIEEQPAVANLLEESTIQSLRSVQHRDMQGNLITDPDLSNPTRPRLERPLDTIRSFERAIDSGYRRRTSYRAESRDQGGPSRRNSYFGSNHNNGYDSRHSPGAGSGYYGQMTPNNNRDSYYSNAPSSSRRPHPNGRQPSEYSSYGAPPAPPAHNYRSNSNAGPSHHAAQPSQDTLATHASGTGSDSTGPWNSGTEPSSDNSSVERMGYYNNGGQPQGGYGGQNGAISEDGAYAYHQNDHQQQQGGYGGGGRPPAVPAKSNGSMGPPSPAASKLPPAVPRPAPAEKRKSWLSRRFSKSG